MQHVLLSFDGVAVGLIEGLTRALTPPPNEYEQARDADGDLLWIDDRGFTQYTVSGKATPRDGWRPLYVKKG